MKKALILVLALSLCSISLGQGEGKMEKREAPKVNAVSPVTELEASKVLVRLEKAVYKLLGKPIPASVPGGTAKPAPREMVLEKFSELFDVAKPKFKVTPKKIKFNPSVLTISKASPLRAKVEKMIAFGCVGKVGPFVTSDKPSFTPMQMGDAVGLFMARIADLTHTPSSRYSPYMSGNNPDSVENQPVTGKTTGGG